MLTTFTQPSFHQVKRLETEVRRSWIGIVLGTLVSTLAFAQSESVKLNGDLVDGGAVQGSLISPDSGRVVYMADQNTDDLRELFSVPIDGGPTTKLVGEPEFDRQLFFSFIIAPDSRNVVFVADLEQAGITELFRVPIVGGPILKLNDPLPPGGDVFNIRFTPDGQRVIFTADQTTNSVTELYSVPADGGPVVKLNAPFTPGGRLVFSQRISPDSQTVVYLADQDTDGVLELYSVPAAGGPVTKLNGPLVEGGNVDGFGVRISPDSNTVVYEADQETNGVSELFAVPTNGGVATKISAPMVSGGGARRFEISSDSTRVIYLANQDRADLTELFSVSISGGEVTKLSDPEAVAPGSFRLSADGTTVVYRSDELLNQLFSVAVTGGPVIQLNAPLPDNERVNGFILSADSASVVYSINSAGDATPKIVGQKGVEAPTTALFRVSINGGLVTQLTEPFNNGARVDDFNITADSELVVYSANQDEVGVFELYGVPIGGGNAVKLNGPLAVGGNVDFFDISRDSNAIVYSADQDTDNVQEIYRVTRGGLGRPDPLFSDGFESDR